MKILSRALLLTFTIIALSCGKNDMQDDDVLTYPATFAISDQEFADPAYYYVDANSLNPTTPTDLFMEFLDEFFTEEAPFIFDEFQLRKVILESDSTATATLIDFNTSDLIDLEVAYQRDGDQLILGNEGEPNPVYLQINEAEDELRFCFYNFLYSYQLNGQLSYMYDIDACHLVEPLAPEQYALENGPVIEGDTLGVLPFAILFN